MLIIGEEKPEKSLNLGTSADDTDMGQVQVAFLQSPKFSLDKTQMTWESTTKSLKIAKVKVI